MNKPINLLVGGLTLFAAQGCKAPKQASQQAEHPNIIYVFPDQYRNQAMGFWRQDGFRDKVNFEGDPVHTPNLDAFARESMVLSSAQSNCPLSSPHRGMLLTCKIKGDRKIMRHHILDEILPVCIRTKAVYH